MTEQVDPDSLIRPANTLYNTERIKRQIRSMLMHVFRDIADKIETANNTGSLRIIISLPVNIVIDGLPGINAQTEVYYHTVSSLKKKGYSVMIDIGKTATKLHVSWKQPVDEQRTKEQLIYLARHSVENAAAEASAETAPGPQANRTAEGPPTG